MPCADVLRQRLPHRAVALLPHLRQHFFLMRRRSVWDVAGIVPLPCGRKLRPDGAAAGGPAGPAALPLSRIALAAAGQRHPLLRGALCRTPARRPPAFPEAWEALSVDTDALKGLQALPDAPLSPLLRRIEPQWLRDYDVAARSAARHSSSQAAACTSPLLATTLPAETIGVPRKAGSAVRPASSTSSQPAAMSQGLSQSS